MICDCNHWCTVSLTQGLLAEDTSSAVDLLNAPSLDRVANMAFSLRSQTTGSCCSWFRWFDGVMLVALTAVLVADFALSRTSDWTVQVSSEVLSGAFCGRTQQGA
jgi:hypothetical protein